MTKLLEDGIKAVRQLPRKRQDVAGEMLLAMAEMGERPRYRPTAEQVEGIKEGLAQADRREYVGEAEMDALLKKCGV